MQPEGFALAIDIDIDTEVDAARLDAGPHRPESRSAFSALGLDNGKFSRSGPNDVSRKGEVRGLCYKYFISRHS